MIEYRHPLALVAFMTAIGTPYGISYVIPSAPVKAPSPDLRRTAGTLSLHHVPAASVTTWTKPWWSRCSQYVETPGPDFTRFATTRRPHGNTSWIGHCSLRSRLRTDVASFLGASCD